MTASACRAAAAALLVSATLLFAQTPPAKFAIEHFEKVSFADPGKVIVHDSTPILELAANRLVYPQRDVQVWVDESPQLEQLGYEIHGLLNPELEFVKGARVTFTLVNWSLSDPGSLQITTVPPPYAKAYPAPAAGWLRVNRRDGYVVPPRIVPPGKTPGPVHGAKFVCQFTAAGNAYYLNAWARHATMGQWGKIVIVP